MTAPTARHGTLRELLELGRLAAPIALSGAGHAAMGMVDTAVVGRLSPAAQAAVGIGNGLFFIVSALGIGVMVGLDPLIAQAFGAGKPLEARRLYWQGNWLALGTSAVLLLPLLFAHGLMRPFGVKPEIAAFAQEYLWWRLPGLLPLLLYFGARAYLQGAGRPGVLALATVLANVVNVGLDILLVFGGTVLPEEWTLLRRVPAMGVAGAGLATALVTALQCALVSGRVATVRLSPGPILRRPAWPQLQAALRVGIPAGLQMSAEVGVFAIAGLLAGSFDKTSGAAHQIAIALASFTFCVALGFSNAGTVRVGWAIGARDTPKARRSGLVALGAGAGVMALFALSFLAFPRPLAALMAGDHPDVVEAAIPLLMVCAVFQLADGLQGVGAGVLRGAGDTRFAFLANVVGHYAVGLPVALGLGLVAGHGVVGVWWGLCAGLFVVAALLVGRFVWLTSRELSPLESAGAEGLGEGQAKRPTEAS